MIARTYIAKNLDTINVRYRRAKSRMEPLYYSKLAVLELCGWIEVSIDDLALRAVRKKVRDARVEQDFREITIKPVYGFHYKNHFRKILCGAIGEILVAKIEKKMDPLKRQQLVSELNSLTKSRNRLAHTYVKGATQSIDAPSRTIQRFNLIYSGLKEFEKQVFAQI